MSIASKPDNMFFDYITSVHTERFFSNPLRESDYADVRQSAVASVLKIQAEHIDQTRVIIEMMLESLENTDKPIPGISLVRSISGFCNEYFFTDKCIPKLMRDQDHVAGMILPVEMSEGVAFISLNNIRQTLHWVLGWMATQTIENKPVVLSVDEWAELILSLQDDIQSKTQLRYAILQFLGHDGRWKGQFETHAALACVKMHLLYAEETRSVDIAEHAIQELGCFFDKKTQLWSEFHEHAIWKTDGLPHVDRDGKPLAFSPENMNNFYDAALKLMIT